MPTSSSYTLMTLIQVLNPMNLARFPLSLSNRQLWAFRKTSAKFGV